MEFPRRTYGVNGTPTQPFKRGGLAGNLEVGVSLSTRVCILRRTFDSVITQRIPPVRLTLPHQSSPISKDFMASCLTKHDCISSRGVSFLHISGARFTIYILAYGKPSFFFFFSFWTSYAPPFDRHDWVVRRPSTNEKVRYVIDYYSVRESLDGEPIFHLDVRPALDSLGNVYLRLMAAIERLLSKVNLFITINVGLLFFVACLVLLERVY